MDRTKSLDDALANIEKQFGTGSVMKLGDDNVKQVAAIPTGALSLDLALGIGGIPRGRVVEVYGPESSGKCHTADTCVWTDRGLETVAELFERVGQPLDDRSRVTDVSSQGIRLVNEDAELEPMAAVTHNGIQRVWRITLESGRHVEATANHPLRVLNEDGYVVWRTVGDLQDGEVLVSAAFGAAESAGACHLSEDEAVLLGYLVSEGSLGEAARHMVAFSNSHDEDVQKEYYTLLKTVLDVPEERIKSYTGSDHVVHDTELRRRLADEYGLDYTTSAGKSVPHVVRTAGAKAQSAFLSALYEGDGWIEDGPEIGYASASRLLAEQVQLLLLGLGIPASLLTKHNTIYERDYYTVLVPPGASQRFLDIVGFRSERRAAQVEARLRENTRPTTRWESVPFMAKTVTLLRDALGGDRELDGLIHDLTRDDLTSREGGAIDASRERLAKIVAWADARHVPPRARHLVELLRDFADSNCTYERIVAVEDAGEQPTFDVVVPRTHSFLANGVLSHNTTIALHAVAEAQKQGGIAAFIDAEHALDPHYAKALGVDVNELLVSQPDTGEQALEIADMLIRSNAVDIIVIDSVAALTPRAEIEGEMGDTHVGLQARLMSQALRKIAGSLSKSDTCMVFINQLREKIGVMFGCMSWETQITLADGSQEYIGKIVNQKMPVEVLSYDTERDEFVPRKVVNWFDNGRTDEFLHITVENPGPTGRGSSKFICTPNHLIMGAGGWTPAGELREGDTVLRPVPHKLSGFQQQVLLGTLMGDAALSPNTNGLSARLRWGHGAKQAAYGDWKAELFGNIDVCRTTNAKGAVFHDVTPLPELKELREAVYIGDKKVFSWGYLKALTPLSLALWYQDDGTFRIRSKGLQERTRGGSGRSEICVEAMSPDTRERLRDLLVDTWGLEVSLNERGGNAFLTFTRAGTDTLHELIAPYVHPSMDYKLLPRLRGQFEVEPEFCEPRQVATPMRIRSIEARPPEHDRTHRFDIEVEGSHSYLAGGVVVHNSPETTPGGRALKFYSSVRLDVRRIESLKDGTNAVGNRVRVKVAKNKVAPPFKLAEFDIMYGEGISAEGSIIDVGVDEGIIRKAGAWYSYDDEQLGQGRENARQFLIENVDMRNEIEKKVKEALGLNPLAADEVIELDEDDEEEDDS